MVTHELLFEMLGRRPFEPFRVLLRNGEQLDVVRPNQATSSPRLFVFGTPQDYFRWILLEQIDRVEPLDLPQTAS